MFSRQSLQQLKEKIDLVDLLNGFLPLKRTGKVYKACCPFHEEKSPSFQVQRGAQHYHCFGCGAHGDAFAFVMHQMGFGFNQAAEFLADRYHVLLESQTKGEDLKRQRLIQLMQEAQSFFVGCLEHHPEGKVALEYLNNRGIDRSFIQRYSLGYCPREGQLLRGYLHEKRFSDDEMIQMGLLNVKKRDFFASRITFPIFNYRFQVIAFSARKFLEETFGGKYINSPETELFKKSRTLFGLPYSRTRMAKEKQVILVEGQIDTLRLIDAGLNFTVAALGTAFGKGHVEELKAIGIEKAWLLFDADPAGQEAACKVGQLLMQEGIEVKVVVLPESEDPDSLLRSQGIEALIKHMDEASGYIEFLVHHRSLGKDLSSPAVKTHLIHQLKEQIQKAEDPLVVYEGLRALARTLCVPEALILDGAKSPQKTHGARLSQNSSPTPMASIDPLNFEYELLASLLTMWSSHPSLMSYCSLYINENHFEDPSCKRLWSYLYEAYQSQKVIDFTSALLDVELDLENLIQTLGSIRPDWTKFEKHLQEAVQTIASRRWAIEDQQLRLEIQSGRLSDERAHEMAKQYANHRQNMPKVQSFLEKPI